MTSAAVHYAPDAKAQSKEDKKKGAQKGPQLSKKAQPAYKAAYDAYQAKDMVKAQEQFEGMKANIETDDDKFLVGQMIFTIGREIKDQKLQADGLQLMVDSPSAPAESVNSYKNALADLYYLAGDYQKSIDTFKALYMAGYGKGKIEIDIANGYTKLADYPNAVTWLNESIKYSEANGQIADRKVYAQAAALANNTRDSNLIVPAFKNLVAKYPSVNTWHDAIITFQKSVELEKQENLDLLRLMRTAGAIKYQQQYGDYVEAAGAQALPGEVLAVLNEGLDNGIIPAGNMSFSTHLDMAKSRVDKDRADLPYAEKDAKAKSTGGDSLATGDAFLGYGIYDKAASLYQMALDKGGVDNDVAYTRMGIAQFKAGNMDAAKQAFSKVTGSNRKAIAQYWMLYIDQQSQAANAKTAAPAS
ncbi:hypothetical protein LPB140_07915 [Sphingorhabdus lutea]|uniref:Tetratricopeptide repeat protein n=2 Tax=Sphingorhabdus lutea TaxID=1913578 RepID=A0A1L3JC69_9SPHN|nr:hypothetical protein LPB140_07915 [Sphingorhabdus lutea]